MGQVGADGRKDMARSAVYSLFSKHAERYLSSSECPIATMIPEVVKLNRVELVWKPASIPEFNAWSSVHVYETCSIDILLELLVFRHNSWDMYKQSGRMPLMD